MTKAFPKLFSDPMGGVGSSPDATTPTSLSAYVKDGVLATLVYDRENGVSGSRFLGPRDYIEDNSAPTLIYDRQNNLSGARP